MILSRKTTLSMPMILETRTIFFRKARNQCSTGGVAVVVGGVVVVVGFVGGAGGGAFVVGVGSSSRGI
jgi:hypothetical protein